MHRQPPQPPQLLKLGFSATRASWTANDGRCNQDLSRQRHASEKFDVGVAMLRMPNSMLFIRDYLSMIICTSMSQAVGQWRLTLVLCPSCCALFFTER